MSSLDLGDVKRNFGFSLCAAPLSDSCPKILEQGGWSIRDWRIGVEDQSCSQSRTLEDEN